MIPFHKFPLKFLRLPIREDNLNSPNKHYKKNKKHSHKQVSFYKPSFVLVKVFVQMKILKLGNPYAYLWWYLLGNLVVLE